MNVKENKIERYLCEQVKLMGGVAEKVTVVGRRGFFDRVVRLPGGKIYWVECKRPRGGRVAPHQGEYASRYEALGVPVAIVRNREDIDALLKK